MLDRAHRRGRHNRERLVSHYLSIICRQAIDGNLASNMQDPKYAVFHIPGLSRPNDEQEVVAHRIEFQS